MSDKITERVFEKMLRRDNKCSILESEKVRTFIIFFGAILMKESFQDMLKYSKKYEIVRTVMIDAIV